VTRFTELEKHMAILRELAYRRAVYKMRVATGKMSSASAEYQIAIFEAIAADYQRGAVGEGEMLL
jgi:hypothetical protein